MAKLAQIPLRVEQQVKEDLETLAKKDKRSTNNYVEVVLENHIALEKQKCGGKL